MTPYCQNCHAHLSADYARVFGGNNDEIRECMHCTTYYDVIRGAAAGTSYRGYGGVPIA